MSPILPLTALALLVGTEGEDPSRDAPPELSLRASERDALDAIIAGRPLTAPADALLALTAPNPNHMNFQYWLDHQTIDIGPDGAFHTEVWRIVRIATDEGAAQIGAAVSGYVEGLDQAPALRARVVCPDAPERVFDPVPLTSHKPVEAARAFTAVRDVAGRIDGVKAGCAVETHWVHRRSATWLKGPFDAGIFAFENGRIEQRLTISVAPNIPLVAGTVNRDLTSTEAKVFTHPDGARTVSHVRRRRTRPALSDDVQPFFLWQVGDRSWPELSAACAARVEPALDRPIPTSALPRPAAGKTRLHTIRRLTDLVRARLDLQPASWLDQAFALTPPAAILKRRKASPFDAALVLAAALRREGMSAHVAFVVGRLSAMRPDLERPSLNAFRRPVVFVEAAGEDGEVWIDATALDLPAGALDSDVLGSHAMWCATRPGTPEGLAALPVRADLSAVAHVQRRVTLGPVADVRVVATVHYDGAMADNLRRYIHARDPAVLRQEFAEVAERGFGGEVVAAKVVRDDGVGPISVEVVVEGGEADVSWSAMTLPPAYFDPWNFMPDDLDPNRTQDNEGGEFFFPRGLSSETVIELPAGFEPSGALPSLDLALGPARWRYASTYAPATARGPATVTTTSALDFGPQQWSTADIRAFRAALTDYRSRSFPDVVLTHRAFDTLANGDAGVGARLFQALLAEHPKDPAVHAMLGFAWLARGVISLGEASISRALALDPKSAIARFADASRIEIEAERRDAGDGKGHAEVVAGWRRAHEAAPRRRDVALELATALSGVDTPWFEVPQADREDGIGRLRTMARVEGMADAIVPYLRVLWHLRGAEDVLRESRGLDLPRQGLLIQLAATAEVEGAHGLRAALIRLGKNGLSQAELGALTLEATLALMIAGKWKTLAALSDRSAEVRLLAEGYGDAPPMGPVAVNREDPGSVALAWLLAASGTPAYTAAGARRTLETLTHPDYSAAVAIYWTDGSLERRSAGVMVTAPEGAALRSARQRQLVSIEGKTGVGARVVVQHIHGHEEVFLAPREKGAREWAVVLQMARGAGLYDRAVSLWAAGEREAAETWFGWAESVRTAQNPKTEVPVAAKDEATRRAKAARFALEVLPSEVALEEARRTLAAEDVSGWEEVGRQLMMKGEDAAALEVLAKLPAAVAEEASWALVARLRSLPAEEARAWVDARVTKWPATVPVTSVLSSLWMHLGDTAWAAGVTEARHRAGEKGSATRLAWAHHLSGRVTAESERIAREAVEAEWDVLKETVVGRRSEAAWNLSKRLGTVYPGRMLRAYLNVWACVLLDLGKVEEGVKAAAEAMPADGVDGPWDRYLAARIAEASGFDAEAARIDAELLAETKDPRLRLAIELRRAAR